MWTFRKEVEKAKNKLKMFTLQFLKTQLESFDESDAKSMKQFKGIIGELIKQGDCREYRDNIGDILTDCFCEVVKLRKFKLAGSIVEQVLERRSYEINDDDIKRFCGINNEKIQKSMLMIYNNVEKIKKNDDYLKLMDDTHLLVWLSLFPPVVDDEFHKAWLDLSNERELFNCNF